VSYISSVEALLQAAKELAKASNYDGAIQQLKQCVVMLEQANDRIGAANIHLMIVDVEKLKAKAAGASATREAARPPMAGKPLLPNPRPALADGAGGSDGRVEEGKKLLANGSSSPPSRVHERQARHRQARQADLAKELESDIARAKGAPRRFPRGSRPVDVSASPAPSTDAGGDRTPQQLFSQTEQFEMYPPSRRRWRPGARRLRGRPRPGSRNVLKCRRA